MRLDFEDLSITLQVDRLPEIEDLLLKIARDIDEMRQDIKEFVESWQEREDLEDMDLSAIQSAVERNTSVTQSVVVFVQQIAQQLKQNAGDANAVRALADQLNNNTQAIADAVTANTPSEGESSGGNIGNTGGSTGGSGESPS